MAKEGPTRDGRFQGRLYECSQCGFTYRRNELVKQKGFLVCKRYCFDKTASKQKRRP